MKGLLGLSIILLTLSSCSKSIVGVTKKANYVSSQVCSGQAAYNNVQTLQLIDEFSFRHSKGRIFLKSGDYNRVKLRGKELYTLAIRFSDDVFERLIFFAHNIKLSIGGELKEEKYNKYNFRYVYGTVVNINSYILKTMIVKNNTLFITFSFPSDDILLNFDFLYSSYDYQFERVQLSYGSYLDFKGFGSSLPPCSISSELTQDEYYLDFDINKMTKVEFINNLINGIVGYDKKSNEYLRIKITKDDFSESSIFDKYVEIILMVEKDGRTKELKIYVKCIDNIAPQIFLKENEEIIIPYYDYDYDSLLNYFNVVDPSGINYVGIDGPKEFQIGENEYVLTAKDSNNNKQVFPFKIKIIDDIPPDIYSPNYIIVSKTNKLTEEILKDLINAEDEIDGTEVKTNFSFGDYLGNEDKTGEYFLEVSAADKSNNVIKKKISLQVIDSEDFTFFIYGSEIEAYFGNKIDLLKTINVLAEDGTIPKNKYVSYVVTSGQDPSKEVLQVGEHKVTLAAMDEEGKTSIINLTINIKEETLQKESKSFIQKVIDFLSRIINAIISFFSNLFK